MQSLVERIDGVLLPERGPTHPYTHQHQRHPDELPQFDHRISVARTARHLEDPAHRVVSEAEEVGPRACKEGRNSIWPKARVRRLQRRVAVCRGRARASSGASASSVRSRWQEAPPSDSLAPMKGPATTTLYMMIAAAVISGCASQRRATRNAEHVATLRTRAAFDMNCPEDRLDVVSLSESAGGQINSAGVRGCGQQLVYVRANNHSNWVLDASSRATR